MIAILIERPVEVIELAEEHQPLVFDLTPVGLSPRVRKHVHHTHLETNA